MFLNDVADMSEVVGIRAVAGSEDVGNKLHSGFFTHVFSVPVIGKKELGVPLKAGGEGRVSAEVCRGVFAAIASRHIQGTGTGPTIKGFHAKVVVIFLGEQAVAVA